MDKKLIDKEKYQKILNLLKEEINKESFERDLKKVQDIDLKHYSKIIGKLEFLKIIEEYKNENLIENEINNVLILLPGNPEILFRVCLDMIRYNVDFTIGIEDFCLSQNTLIIDVIKNILEKLNIRISIDLKNLMEDREIIEISNEIDRTIIIGNSNLYNRLEDKVENLKFNTYGIFEVYSDSQEYEELEEKFYEYLEQNGFEGEGYSDINFEDAIRIINKKGYHFCTILFSKDKNKQKVFEENVNSEYVIINKNPFEKIKLKLEII